MKRSKSKDPRRVTEKRWWLPVVSVQAVHQFRKDARFDEIIDGGVTVTGQQLPGKANTGLTPRQQIQPLTT